MIIWLLIVFYIGSPGHAAMLQLSVLVVWPTQLAPSPCGAGFVQIRVRVREPTSQVAEQLLQDDHWVQPLSTATQIKQ